MTSVERSYWPKLQSLCGFYLRETPEVWINILEQYNSDRLFCWWKSLTNLGR